MYKQVYNSFKYTFKFQDISTTTCKKKYEATHLSSGMQ